MSGSGDFTTREPLARFRVPESLDGERLDRALAAAVPGLSRGRARKLAEAGSVFVDRVRVRICSRAVRASQEVVCYELAPVVSETPAVVLETGDFIILDKPAGMPVEPTRSGVSGTVSGWLEKGIPGGGLITHRLDAATSGLLVVARHQKAQAVLNRMFGSHEIRRYYVGVVSPPPAWSLKTVEMPLDGRPAVTHARVLSRSPRAAALVLELETGRTRQIRRHLASEGSPVAGDTAGGGVKAARLLLHACWIRFEWEGRPVLAHAPVPAAWKPELDRFDVTVPPLERPDGSG